MKKQYKKDLVKVTRCKDCIHWQHVISNKWYCEFRSLPSSGDDFCSFAEKREKNDQYKRT